MTLTIIIAVSVVVVVAALMWIGSLHRSSRPMARSMSRRRSRQHQEITTQRLRELSEKAARRRG